MLISIASGKGGTGKTTIATNLAQVISTEMDTWFLDCDVEAPNAHLFLTPQIDKTQDVSLLIPEVDDSKCDGCGVCDEVCAFNAIVVLGDKAMVFPEICHSCGGCSRCCPKKAISETPVRIGQVEAGRAGDIRFFRGVSDVGVAVVTPVVKAVKNKAWLADENTAVLIDAPPGTGCPVVAAVSGSDYCVLVTEPTPFGLNDLKLAVQLVRHMGIDCGVVINRCGLTGSESDVDAYCESEGIPILARIPFDRRYAGCYARGGIWVNEFPELHNAFNALWASITAELAAGGSAQ